MNRKGLTAFVDVMIFMVIIMMAISVTLVYSHNGVYSHEDPEDILSRLTRTEMRLSDLTDIEDDSLVYLIDLMDYDITNESQVGSYLNDLLIGVYGDHRFIMEYSNQSGTVVLGDAEGFLRYQTSRELRASNGDTINVSLGVV